MLDTKNNPYLSMKKTFLAALLVGLTVMPCALAQMGAPAGINAALPKLFGDITAFSAKADMQVLDKEQKEKITAPMDFALLDKKVRVELDMTRMKNKDLPPTALAGMKQMGMDRVITISPPDQKTTCIIFPGLEAYFNLTVPQDDVATFEKDSKVTKTALGKETINGHPCVKNQVVITDDKGEKHEATVWSATDLKDFPVRILSKEKDDTIIMNFKDIKLAKPDAKLFEKPAGYTEYPSKEAMMQAVMMKMMQSGAGTK